MFMLPTFTIKLVSRPGGMGIPYMDYIGMYGPKGYGFSVIFVINNSVKILADFGHYGHK